MIASSILLAFDNPLAKQNTKITIQHFDLVLTSIFIVEIIIKVIALGFINCGKSSYIRNIWNTIDFIICISSIVDISLTRYSAFRLVKILRLFRIIKPLLKLSKNDGLKIALQTLY